MPFDGSLMFSTRMPTRLTEGKHLNKSSHVLLTSLTGSYFKLAIIVAENGYDRGGNSHWGIFKRRVRKRDDVGGLEICMGYFGWLAEPLPAAGVHRFGNDATVSISTEAG
jgi:hypothetical protein